MAESDIDLILKTGYLEFLPMPVLRRNWSSGDIDMYAALPRKEVRFLDLLKYLEEAGAGNSVEDPAISAFYRLSGYYNRPCPAMVLPLFTDSVNRYRAVVENCI